MADYPPSRMVHPPRQISPAVSGGVPPTPSFSGYLPLTGGSLSGDLTFAYVGDHGHGIIFESGGEGGPYLVGAPGAFSRTVTIPNETGTLAISPNASAGVNTVLTVNGSSLTIEGGIIVAVT